jgi:hypothetical protein
MGFNSEFKGLKGATISQGKEEYSTNIKIKKGNWIGHILRTNCLLKYVIGKKGGKMRKKK